MTYLFIMHHCTHVEILTPEQEELELEIVGDSRQAPKHFLHPILDQRSICVLFAHELLYIYIIDCIEPI